MFVPGNEIKSPSAYGWSSEENDSQQTIGIPQEFDESGSNFVLEGFCLAEHDLSRTGWRSRTRGDEVTMLLTSTALSSSGVYTG